MSLEPWPLRTGTATEIHRSERLPTVRIVRQNGTGFTGTKNVQVDFLPRVSQKVDAGGGTTNAVMRSSDSFISIIRTCQARLSLAFSRMARLCATVSAASLNGNPLLRPIF